MLLHSRLYFHYQFQGELTFYTMPAFTKINSQKCRASTVDVTHECSFFYINGAAAYRCTVGSIRLPKSAHTQSLLNVSFYEDTLTEM